MNAQVKRSAVEQAGIDIRLQNRRGEVFEIEQAKARDGLQDEIQETVMLYLDKILANHAAGDDLDTGTIIANCIANYAMHIHSSRLAEELRNEFIPSWRSRCEP